MGRKKRNMTEGPVPGMILKLTGGMVFGLLAMSAFNAADTYFVGQLGSVQLAAMSYTFPVVMILNSLAWGLGVGLSSTVSRAIGAGDRHKVVRLTTDGLLLAFLVVIVLAAVGLVTIRPLFSLLGARGQTLEYIVRYMRIWYLGIPFVVIPMAGNNVIRATGDTLIPSLIMIVSVVTNIILDPLLIFGPGPFPAWGISGAAIATVSARFTTLIFSLCILGFREKLLSLEKPDMGDVLDNWRSIAFVGVPASLVQAVTPLSLGVVTRLLARFGDSVVAGFGAAGRLEMISLIVPMSMASVMGPFSGQNWGAGKPGRIRTGLLFASSASILWGVLIFLGALLFADPLLSLFNETPAIVGSGASYLRIVSISYGFLGILLISTQILNGMNKPLQAGMLTLAKAFVVNIPLAFIGAFIMQEKGIFAATSLSNLFGGVLAVTMVFFMLRRTDKTA